MADENKDGQAADENKAVGNVDAPEKFVIGDKVFTKGEAEAALKAATELQEKLKAASDKILDLEAFEADTRKVMNDNSIESFRRVAKRSGWDQSKIDERIAALSAAKNAAPGKGNDGEDLDEDDDEDDVRPGRGNTSPRKVKFEDLDESLQAGLQRMTGVLGAQIKGQIKEDVVEMLTGDPIVSKAFKRGDKVKATIIKEAVEKAVASAQSRGGYVADVLNDSLATARGIVDTFGLDQEPVPDSSVPSLGGGPGLFSATGYKAGGKIEKRPVGSSGYAPYLGSLLASKLGAK